MIHLDRTAVEPFVDPAGYSALQPRVRDAHTALLAGTGAGSDFLGWRNLFGPERDGLIGEIESVASEIRANAESHTLIPEDHTLNNDKRLILIGAPLEQPDPAKHHITGDEPNQTHSKATHRSFYDFIEGVFDDALSTFLPTNSCCLRTAASAGRDSTGISPSTRR